MLERIKLTDIRSHCLAHAPNEAGGYINTDGVFVPLVNLSSRPTEAFRFDIPDEKAIAVIHSHPGGPFSPSEMDQRQQRASGIPWGIFAFKDDREEFFWFGDEAPIPPLIGRGFRNYVTDCYAAMRDLYRQECYVTLPAFFHDWNWWKTGQQLIEAQYVDAGFKRIPDSQIRPGDVVLISIRSSTPNHTAVWIGDGLIYHHSSSRLTDSDPKSLSRVESAGPWMPHISAVLRHENSAVARAPWPLIRQKLQAGH